MPLPGSEEAPPPPNNDGGGDLPPGVVLLGDLVKALMANTEAQVRLAKSNMALVRSTDGLAGSNHSVATVHQQSIGMTTQTLQVSSEISNILGDFHDVLMELGPRLKKVSSFRDLLEQMGDAYEVLEMGDEEDEEEEL